MIGKRVAKSEMPKQPDVLKSDFIPNANGSWQSKHGCVTCENWKRTAILLLAEPTKALIRCISEQRGVALGKLQELQTAIGNIRRRPLPWIPISIYGVLSDRDRPWRELLHATASALTNLRERARQAHDRQVQLPVGA